MTGGVHFEESDKIKISRILRSGTKKVSFKDNRNKSTGKKGKRTSISKSPHLFMRNSDQMSEDSEGIARLIVE